LRIEYAHQGDVMAVEQAMPIEFSEHAAAQVKKLISEEENPNLKLRVYVTGGGCSGFQYGFTLLNCF